jgi:hypothetical protein
MSKIIHARDVPYWELKDMKKAVKACHYLFEKTHPAWDELYMLKIMSYGQLQRGYHEP